MSVGVGMKGLEVAVTVGGLTLLGQVSKGITCNNEPLDTTDDAANGWRELLAKPGVKTIDLAINGTFKNLELLAAFTQDTSQMYEVVITYPDGLSTPSTLTFDAFMTDFEHTAESNTLHTYSASFQSSGEPTFVAAT